MTLPERMAQDGYDGYAYSYPHKTAYRPLEPAHPLQQAWSTEDRRNLFLYVHLPFCEMRCGFCNLFTTVRPAQDLVGRTLEALERQSRQVADCVQPQGLAQAAVGGGTPTYLSEAQLARLFASLRQEWPLDCPLSLEVSPGTVTPAKLKLLKDLGVDRISLGAQSFLPEDLKALGRPQPEGELERACDLIAAAGFPVFNVDLIYGNEGQDERRWRESLERALRWRPEELYLYPLYVGRLTGLDRLGRRPGERRRALYRLGRDLLQAAGYQALSMRQFRRRDVDRATDYCCQDDGMVGLGPGARSYTRALHYSTEYAVAQPGVRGIIHRFNDRKDFTSADYGVILDVKEQKLRYVIKSLLRAEGLDAEAYRRRFRTEVWEDVPQLRELGELTEGLRLTEEGLAWSDTIGPWLYSEEVAARMRAYQPA